MKAGENGGRRPIRIFLSLLPSSGGGGGGARSGKNHWYKKEEEKRGRTLPEARDKNMGKYRVCHKKTLFILAMLLYYSFPHCFL